MFTIFTKVQGKDPLLSGSLPLAVHFLFFFLRVLAARWAFAGLLHIATFCELGGLLRLPTLLQSLPARYRRSCVAGGSPGCQCPAWPAGELSIGSQDPVRGSGLTAQHVGQGGLGCGGHRKTLMETQLEMVTC